MVFRLLLKLIIKLLLLMFIKCTLNKTSIKMFEKTIGYILTNLAIGNISDPSRSIKIHHIIRRKIVITINSFICVIVGYVFAHIRSSIRTTAHAKHIRKIFYIL